MATCKHVESSDGTEKIVLSALENTCLRLHVGSLFVDDLPVVPETVRFKIEDFTDLA